VDGHSSSSHPLTMTTSIRMAQIGDAAAIAAIYAPFVCNTSVSFEMTPPSSEEMAERMRKTLAIAPYLVSEDAAGITGYAYAGQWRTRAAYQWTTEVSVYLDPRAHGRGIGTKLYGVLLDLLRVQGYRMALGGVTLPNAASVALHEKLGFDRISTYRAVGHKFGAWHDVGWWQLDLGDIGNEPQPPRTPTRAALDPRWNEILERAKRGN
jgi:L-amino acid N-acyltransferase YncA